MYKKDRHRQFGLTDFNQPIGLKMNPENRWVKKADMVPWDEIEDRYADLFHQPEMFVKMGKGINVIPLPDEMVQGLQEAAKSAMEKPGKVQESKEAHSKRQDRDDR